MRRLLYVLVASVALLSSGCFSSGKVKPRKDVATETEELFRQRWVAQRVTELTSGSNPLEAREARRQAVADFNQQFPHTSVARRGDPMGDGTLP